MQLSGAKPMPCAEYTFARGPAGPRVLDTGPHLFIDDYLIEALSG